MRYDRDDVCWALGISREQLRRRLKVGEASMDFRWLVRVAVERGREYERERVRKFLEEG